MATQGGNLKYNSNLENARANLSMEIYPISRAAEFEKAIRYIEQSKELSALYDSLPTYEKLNFIRDLVR